MDSDPEDMVNDLDERAPLMTGIGNNNTGTKNHGNPGRENVQTYVPPRLDYDLVSLEVFASLLVANVHLLFFGSVHGESNCKQRTNNQNTRTPEESTQNLCKPLCIILLSIWGISVCNLVSFFFS
jgi:hypothetical protein